MNRIGRPIPSVRPRAAVAAAGVVGMPAIAPGVVSCQDSTRQLAQHRASDGMSCRGVPDGLAASAAVRPARLSRPSAGGSSLPEICQKRCLAMPHTAPCPLRLSTTAVELRRCDVTRDAAWVRVAPALPSHHTAELAYHACKAGSTRTRLRGRFHKRLIGMGGLGHEAHAHAPSHGQAARP